MSWSKDEKEECIRFTHEALEEVVAGRIIDHSVVQAWVDSLDEEKPLPPLKR